jgi:TRAP-type C4-dicarboxylate transport system substrate-binding protein
MTPAIPIRFGGYQPPTSVHHRAADVLGRALRARLGPAVQFELVGNIMDAGHRAADLLTMVEQGTMTMCYFSASYLAARVPEFALLDLPFLLSDRTHAYAVLDGPLGHRLAAQLRAGTGFQLLGFWDNGFRHLSNRLRPIRTPADCQGLRLRTLMSELHQQVFSLLGFEPVFLDVKDLIDRVRTGTIDAQENPLTNIYNFGIHAHHRYMTLSSHFFGVTVLLCHQPTYEAWPHAMQQDVLAAVAEATAAQRRLAAREDDEVLARLDPRQNDIIHLTEAERALFLEAVAPVLEAQRQRFGDALCDSLRP